MSEQGEVLIEGFSIDVVRRLLNSGFLPPERTGYILAQLALSEPSPDRFDEFSRLAFHKLIDEETGPDHIPPLDCELKEFTAKVVERQESIDRPSRDILIRFALASIVDFGNKNDHRHDPGEGLI